MSGSSCVLDPGNQVFLCVRGFGRDEYRVVTGNCADHAGPAAAIEGEGDALCCADARMNNKKIRTGRRHAAQQVCHTCDLVVPGIVRRWQLVAPGGLDGPDFAQVTADT